MLIGSPSEKFKRVLALTLMQLISFEVVPVIAIHFGVADFTFFRQSSFSSLFANVGPLLQFPDTV